MYIVLQCFQTGAVLFSGVEIQGRIGGMKPTTYFDTGGQARRLEFDKK